MTEIAELPKGIKTPPIIVCLWDDYRVYMLDNETNILYDVETPFYTHMPNFSFFAKIKAWFVRFRDGRRPHRFCATGESAYDPDGIISVPVQCNECGKLGTGYHHIHRNKTTVADMLGHTGLNNKPCLRYG